MLNDYCFNQCPIGQEYKNQVLQNSDSVFDAVYAYKNLIRTCLLSCHKFNKEEEKIENGNE